VRRDTPAVALAGLLFFLSGAAALVYQVAWQRLLALHSGVGLYSVAMIVAAFMAGLGIGSHLGGRLSTRLDAGRALAAFAVLELGISAFGASSTHLYYDWLYPRAVHLPSPSWLAGLLHLLALLPPTTLMGMSLPFLVRATVTDVEGAGRRIGWLYGVNVLGAAAGALATPWLLLPALGVRGSVVAAAGANLGVGLGALGLFALRKRPPAGPGQPAVVSARAPDPEAPGSRPLTLWLSLYALSGFLALSLEIVWFRLLDVAVKSTAFTFGTVLAVYLLGSAVGALLGAPLVARVRRPLRAFLLAQCAILALAVVPVILVVTLPPDGRGLSWFVEYWAGYAFFPLGHDPDRATILRLYVLLPLALFFVPTVLMGVSFPILQRAVHDDPATSGRKVGALQAANIAGCTAGSLLVGLVCLQRLGTPGTLRLLVVLGILFALAGLRYYGRVFLLPAITLAVLAAVVPGPERLWRRLHGVPARAPLVLFEEDATSVVALTPDEGGFRLSVNGKGNSWLPYGSGHTLLGAIPATVHPAPADVAVVGLGSGDTAWASAWRPETRSLTVFEISGPQPRILWRLVGLVDVFDTRRLLEDPRLRIRIEDGRKALEAGEARYDLVETDATWPETAGSGNLYSVEFFEAVSRRLKPAGLMCTWAPTPRVVASFRAVFPHVLEAEGGEVLIGSLTPIPYEPEAWTERARSSLAYLGPERTKDVMEAVSQLRPAGAVPAVAPNRDLFPRDEYAVK
jgi:predicted membrane-bound spermidine synthase